MATRMTTIRRQTKMAIGQRIKFFRNRKGMTQKQLSDITGITQADISRLESGTANPSLRTLKRLAAGMGMALKLEFIPTQTQI